MKDKLVLFSPGVNPSAVNKMDYQVCQGRFRCVHEGCRYILSRQCWRSHIEMDHIDGVKTFKKILNGMTFPCTDCAEVLPTRRARELHRRKAHSLKLVLQEEFRRKREEKALAKQEQILHAISEKDAFNVQKEAPSQPCRPPGFKGGLIKTDTQ